MWVHWKYGTSQIIIKLHSIKLNKWYYISDTYSIWLKQQTTNEDDEVWSWVHQNMEWVDLTYVRINWGGKLHLNFCDWWAMKFEGKYIKIMERVEFRKFVIQ